MSIAGAVLIVGLWLVVWCIMAIPIFRQVQLIRRTRTTWISALPAHGRVEVVGQAEGESIASALGQVPCLAWQIELVAERRTRKRISWERIFEKSSTEAFKLDDGTGKVLIQPTNANIILAEGEPITDSLETLKERLIPLGFTEAGKLVKARKILVFERRVSAGQEIYVAGYIQPGEGYKTITGLGTSPLRISDGREADTMRDLYGKLVLKGLMSFFIFLGAAIIYFGLINS